MVEALASKTLAWEKERGIEFTYDGVSTFVFPVNFMLSAFHSIICILLVLFYADSPPFHARRVYCIKGRERARTPTFACKNPWHFWITLFTTRYQLMIYHKIYADWPALLNQTLSWNLVPLFRIRRNSRGSSLQNKRQFMGQNQAPQRSRWWRKLQGCQLVVQAVKDSHLEDLWFKRQDQIQFIPPRACLTHTQLGRMTGSTKMISSITMTSASLAYQQVIFFPGILHFDFYEAQDIINYRKLHYSNRYIILEQM